MTLLPYKDPADHRPSMSRPWAWHLVSFYPGNLPGQNGRLGHGGQENELLPKPVEAGEWWMLVVSP